MIANEALELLTCILASLIGMLEWISFREEHLHSVSMKPAAPLIERKSQRG